MNKQLNSRLSSDVVALVLAKFNAREISAAEACLRLGVGRTRLYDLRTQWLRKGADFRLGTSGGDSTGGWPELMDLFAARHETRAVVGGNRIEFMGRSYEIGATSRKRVWLVMHPNVFRVVEEDPLAHRDRWPPRLGSFSR